MSTPLSPGLLRLAPADPVTGPNWPSGQQGLLARRSACQLPWTFITSQGLCLRRRLASGRLSEDGYFNRTVCCGLLQGTLACSLPQRPLMQSWGPGGWGRPVPDSGWALGGGDGLSQSRCVLGFGMSLQPLQTGSWGQWA